MGGFIYTSSDYGQTWALNTNLPNSDWNSVSLSSSGQYQLVCVGRGGGIHTSSDYGQTWIFNTNAPTGLGWNAVSISSSGQYQSATGNGRLYVSTDYGQTWRQITTIQSAGYLSTSTSASGQYQLVVSNSSVFTCKNNIDYYSVANSPAQVRSATGAGYATLSNSGTYTIGSSSFIVDTTTAPVCNVIYIPTGITISGSATFTFNYLV